MTAEAVIMKIEGSVHEQYLMEHTWLCPVLGVRFVARGSTQTVPMGVIVSEVTEDCIFKESLSPGLLVDTVDGQQVSSLSFNAVMDILDTPSRPVTVGFRGTVERAVLEVHQRHQSASPECPLPRSYWSSSRWQM
jgi:hypothetical protein